MFAAEVCVRAECDIPVAKMTVMNGLDRRRTFQRAGLKEEGCLLSTGG